MREARPHDPRCPEVFLDFNFPSRTKYPSYLEVELGFINKSNKEIARKHISRAPWEKEIGLDRWVPKADADVAAGHF